MTQDYPVSFPPSHRIYQGEDEAMKRQARTVTFDGRTSKVRGNVAIPDLSAMPRFDALVWLNRNTYATGYSRATNPLAGFGGAIKVTA